MKKSILNLIIALVLVSTSTFANNTPSITTGEAKSLIVNTKNWKSAFISIEIRNDDGALIFEEKYSTQNGKRLSFENLPQGRYSIILSDNFKSTEQFFTLNSKEVTIYPNIVTVFNPIININEEIIDLNYLAPGKNTTVSVSDDNSTFFDFEFKNEQNINKRFDISELPSGTYTIHVYSENSYSFKTFQK